MKNIILCTLILSSLAAWAEDPALKPATAPASPAPSPVADDLSSYKTADALWSHLGDQTKALRQALQQQDPSVKTLVPQILTNAKAFVVKYPADTHIWDAKMMVVQIGGLATQLQLDSAPTDAELTQELSGIAGAKEAPKMVRAEANAFLIREALQQAAEGKGADAGAKWDAADAKIADFEKEFGPDFSFGGTHPAIVMLRAQQMDVLKESGDTARYQALLQKLSSDPQAQVAAQATQQLTAQKKLADLKTKPFDLKFTAVDGTVVDLSKMRGKVVLIDFWATWCGPCRAEVPNVVAAYKKYHDQGFEVVGVSLDQDKDAMLLFTKAKGMVWPQYFDGQGWDNSVSKSFGIDSIPAMWLIDKKGMLVTTDASDDLAGQVEKLLKAP